MRYLIERPDGSFDIMGIAEGYDIKSELPRWCALPGNVAKAVHEIGDGDLPSDRTFRNAWRRGAGGIKTCMATAREIHKGRIRVKRAERFKDTDAVLSHAILGGRDAGDVLAHVQALRDAPADPAIAAAETPEALKAVWPEALSAPVPALGGPVVRGEGGQAYDTAALEQWAKGLQSKIEAMEAERVTLADGVIHAMKDAQAAAAAVHAMAAKMAKQNDLLKEMARATDFVIREGGGRAELTEEVVS